MLFAEYACKYINGKRLIFLKIGEIVVVLTTGLSVLTERDVPFDMTNRLCKQIYS